MLSAIAFIIVGFILSLIFLVLIGINLKEIAPIVQIFAFISVPISAFIALNQYKQTIRKNAKDEAWNSKYQAYVKINEYVKELESKRTLLDELTIKNKMILDSDGKYISYSDRLSLKTPIKPDEIHKWVCEKNKDNQNEMVMLHQDKNLCAMSEDGAKVVRALLSILNTYEMIAIGINEGLLNKEMVLKSIKKSIIFNFEIMQEYILHRRTKHNSKEFAVIWEKLYIELKKAE